MKRTLHEEIQRNKVASVFYSVLLVALLVSLGTSITGAFAPDSLLVGALVSAAVGVGAGLFALFGGPAAILQMSGATEISWSSHQELHNVVEEMAIAAGLPMPKVYVIHDSAPNAFATGISPDKGVIAITTGLLDKLDRDELQGVIAHEMAHIRNYDVRFMSVIAIVAGLIPLIADTFLRSLRFAGRSRSSKNDGAAIFLIIAIVLAIVAPIFSLLLKMAVSRKREFMADATAAQLTRLPEGLARALYKIAKDTEPLEVANRATQHMYIINPLRLDGGGSSLFSTHPSTDERIRRLLGMAGNPADPLSPVHPLMDKLRVGDENPRF